MSQNQNVNPNNSNPNTQPQNVNKDVNMDKLAIINQIVEAGQVASLVDINDVFVDPLPSECRMAIADQLQRVLHVDSSTRTAAGLNAAGLNKMYRLPAGLTPQQIGARKGQISKAIDAYIRESSGGVYGMVRPAARLIRGLGDSIVWTIGPAADIAPRASKRQKVAAPAVAVYVIRK